MTSRQTKTENTAETRAEAAHATKHESSLQSGIDKAISWIWGTDPTETASEASLKLSNPAISTTAAEFLKTAALFMPGRCGLGATIFFNVIDAVDPHTDTKTKMLDGLMGGMKGASMRASFAIADSFGLGTVGKGLFLGLSNRFSESTFDHHRFCKLFSGSPQSLIALEEIGRTTVDLRAAGADAVSFALAAKMSGALATRLGKSPLLQNVITGAAFGGSSAGYAEFQKQSATGQFDFLVIGRQAGVRAILDGVAAAPGGWVAGRITGKNVGAQDHGMPEFEAETGEARNLKAIRESFTQAPSEAFSSEIINRLHAEGVQSVLETIDVAERAKLWSLAAKQPDGLFTAADLTLSIRLLPPAERIAAFDHILNKGYNRHLAQVMDSIPPSDLPALAESIVSGGANPGLMRRIPSSWQTMEELAPEQSALLVAETIRRLDGSSAQFDWSLVQDWWQNMPEPSEWTNGPDQTPVRDAVCKALEPSVIVQVLFGKRSHLGQSLSGDTILLRTIASSCASVENASALQSALMSWKKTGSTANATREMLRSIQTNFHSDASYLKSMSDTLGAMAETASAADRVQTFKLLLEAASPSVMFDSQIAAFAVRSAARLSHLAPNEFQKHFMEPLQSLVGERALPYNSRLLVSREIASLQRNGLLPENSFPLPEIRMPAIEIPETERIQLVDRLEDALFDDARLRSLLGSGTLGKFFPTVFGNTSEGGIVGRPQHVSHPFKLDEHTLRVVKAVREHSEFGDLSRKDQVDVLMAALFHDVAKRAGVLDPGHERPSANMGWGVLKSLGYAPERIQRISNLIARHRETSYNPGNLASHRLSQAAQLDDLSAHYRHPSAAKQLAILNEADIKGGRQEPTVDSSVVAELQAVRRALEGRVFELNRESIPLLTDALPQKFGLFQAPEEFAWLVHASMHIADKRFVEQLTLMESSECSASLSLITAHHRETFSDSPILAVFAGPFEHISNAYRGSLGTGKEAGWSEHLSFLREGHTMSGPFAAELDTKLSALGFGKRGQPLSALADVRVRLSQFDNATEVAVRRGKTDPLFQAHHAIIEAMTRRESGAPLEGYNEVKMVSPVLTGFFIRRNGQNVQFQNMPADQLARLTPNGVHASWLSRPNTSVSAHTIVVPEHLWQEAKARNLPIMIID